MLSYGRTQALLRHMRLSSTSSTSRRVYSGAIHRPGKIRKNLAPLVTRPIQRGAKTKVSINLDELPQGTAFLDPLPDIKDVLAVEQEAQPKKRRGRKKVSVEINDLPQGVIPLDPLPAAQDVQEYPTVIQQARNNMRRFDNCVLLTRVGGFYEFYFEHAEECGPQLNLKVAQRRTSAGPVSMVRILS